MLPNVILGTSEGSRGSPPLNYSARSR